MIAVANTMRVKSLRWQSIIAKRKQLTHAKYSRYTVYHIYMFIDPAVGEGPIGSLDSPLPVAHNEMKLKQMLKVGLV